MRGLAGMNVANSTCSFLYDPSAIKYPTKDDAPLFARTHIELLPTPDQCLPEPKRISKALVASKIKSLPTLSSHRNSFHKPKNDGKQISDKEMAHSVFAQSDVAKNVRRLGK